MFLVLQFLSKGIKRNHYLEINFVNLIHHFMKVV